MDETTKRILIELRGKGYERGRIGPEGLEVSRGSEWFRVGDEDILGLAPVYKSERLVDLVRR